MAEPELGLYGEQLVQAWLTQQGWTILYHRWHCRWGELDIVAQGYHAQGGSLSSPMLIFVEVKTRSQGNWDLNGLLAMTRLKQKKLWTTARLFLTRHPQLAQLPCRMDVALVRCQPLTVRNGEANPSGPQNGQSTQSKQLLQTNPEIRLPLPDGKRCLVLQDYLVNAIEASG